MLDVNDRLIIKSQKMNHMSLMRSQKVNYVLLMRRHTGHIARTKELHIAKDSQSR